MELSKKLENMAKEFDRYIFKLKFDDGQSSIINSKKIFKFNKKSKKI